MSRKRRTRAKPAQPVHKVDYNRRNGFTPDDVDGRMFNKNYYGLNVPDREDFDEMNAVKLRYVSKGPTSMYLEGYISIDPRKINPSNQDHFIDGGRVERIHPSATKSGYARNKYGRGKDKDQTRGY